MNTSQQLDKAGEAYWSELWHANSIPTPISTAKGSLGNYANECLHGYFSSIFSGQNTQEQSLLEVGCARSVWLPYFAREFGFTISGLDYSEFGCQQSKSILESAGVTGNIVCADLFTPPSSLLENFDVVVSFGVIEHFTDTSACVKSLSQFLKPGGILISIVPNMAGWTGILQKLLAPQVYSIHVPLNKNDLYSAHRMAGLSEISCAYFMGINLSVINIENWSKNFGYKLVVKIRSAISKFFWSLERQGLGIKPNQFTSPSIVCSARKLPIE